MWIVEKKCNDLFSRLCIQRRLIIYLGWKCSVYGKSDPIVLPEGREFVLIHLITGIVRFQGYLLRVYGTGTNLICVSSTKKKELQKRPSTGSGATGTSFLAFQQDKAVVTAKCF